MKCIYCKDELIAYPGSQGESVQCVKCKIIFNRLFMEQASGINKIGTRSSGILDKNDREICDGDLVKYTRKYCNCSESTKTQTYTCKVKFEYGGFYLLFTGDDTIYDKECSTQIGKTLSELAMRKDDHGDGYLYYLPTNKLNCIEVIY